MLIDRQRSGTSLDLGNLDRKKIPDIDADVDRVVASLPVFVHVPEKLQGATSCIFERDHRVMTQHQLLIAIRDFDEGLDRGPAKRERRLRIVISDDKVLPVGDPVEAALQIASAAFAAKREIPQDVEIVVPGDAGL